MTTMNLKMINVLIFQKQQWLKILTSFLCVSLLLLAGCEPLPKKASLQRIIDRGYVKVGTLYGPSSYYIAADGPAGFEYELAKTYADYLGVELKIVPSYQLEELLPKLDNSEVDFLAAGLAITPKRLEEYNFSPSYHQVSQKVVFKQGNTWPRALEELTGSLFVTSSSSHAENLLALKNTYPELAWQESSEFDNEELLLKILEDEIDYTVIDSHVLAMSRRYYPEISIAFTIKDPEYLAWLVSKKNDDSILASLIEFFGQVNNDGTLLVLDDKYYGHVEEFDYVDTRQFLKAITDKLPKYQPLFEKYSQGIDWRLLAAISYQESHWKPHAKSYTGVRGMMMLTLATAKQMGIKSRLDAEESILGGAKYLQRLIKKMPNRIPEPDRLWFALASYNIGFGHLNDARIITQRQGGDPDRWFDVKTRLPLLKQKKHYKKTKYGYARGDEAVNYVESIRRYYESLTFLDDKSQKERRAIPISTPIDNIAQQTIEQGIEHNSLETKSLGQ